MVRLALTALTNFAGNIQQRNSRKATKVKLKLKVDNGDRRQKLDYRIRYKARLNTLITSTAPSDNSSVTGSSSVASKAAFPWWGIE
jgi:flagellar basal body-associated protein FliL